MSNGYDAAQAFEDLLEARLEAGEHPAFCGDYHPHETHEEWAGYACPGIAPVPPVLLPADRATRLSVLGEALHAGWRKGSDAPQAMPVHRLIDGMEAGQWGAYVEWMDEALGQAGYRS